MKYVVKEVIAGTSSEIRQRSEDTILGQLKEGKGVGRDAVLAVLPDMNRNVVDQQLANLKASGEYVEIVKEVDVEFGSELSAQILAAAVKYVVREAVGGVLPEIRQHSDAIILGHLKEGKGVGWSAVLAVLPDMNRNVVDQQLANLKASGIYADIIASVQKEIEAGAKPPVNVSMTEIRTADHFPDALRPRQEYPAC